MHAIKLGNGCHICMQVTHCAESLEGEPRVLMAHSTLACSKDISVLLGKNHMENCRYPDTLKLERTREQTERQLWSMN